MMQPLTRIFIILLLSTTAIHAETTNESPEENSDNKKSEEQKNEAQKVSDKKTDERGFDPCLINSNLDVCKKK